MRRLLEGTWHILPSVSASSSSATFRSLQPLPPARSDHRWHSVTARSTPDMVSTMAKTTASAVATSSSFHHRPAERGRGGFPLRSRNPVAAATGSSDRSAGRIPRFHLRPRPITVVGGDVAGARDDFDVDSKSVAVAGLSSAYVVWVGGWRLRSEARRRHSSARLPNQGLASGNRHQSPAPDPSRAAIPATAGRDVTPP